MAGSGVKAFDVWLPKGVKLFRRPALFPNQIRKAPPQTFRSKTPRRDTHSTATLHAFSAVAAANGGPGAAAGATAACASAEAAQAAALAVAAAAVYPASVAPATAGVPGRAAVPC